MENALPQSRGYGWGRILREIILGSCLMLALLTMIGAIYQWVSERRDMQLHPPPGRMIEVGGYRLHLNCSGSGSPTVILDSGADAVSLHWFKVQPEVAKFTRVCSYDRAGYGWSDLAPTIPYVDENAKRLHTLLTNAGVASPFVMVGQSYGGLIVRMFEHQYPEEVSGAVLVESMHEDQFERLGGSQAPSPVWARKLASGAVRLGARVGLWRVLSDPTPINGVPPDLLAIHQAVEQRTSKYDAEMAMEGTGIQSLEQVRATKFADGPTPFGDKPLIILTSSASPSAWKDLQAELANLSTRGKYAVVQKSSHNIQLERPDAVTAAIREIVDTSRQSAP